MLRPSNSARRIDTEALKTEHPLVDVVAAYGIPMRRESAGTYRALCPFHQEHTPSFWIDARGDPSEQHYFCFGCTSHGDVMTFVMEREGCSFQEACERLSTRGLPPVVQTSQKALSLSLKKPPERRWEELSADSAESRAFDLALKVYENTLWQDARAQAYLRRRGISEEVARAQRLGYANGRALLDWLRSRKDSGEDLLPVAVQLGLVLERPGAEDDRPAHREFFLDRLIIPELRQGRPIWCIGRAVEDSIQSAVPIEVSPSVPVFQERALAAEAGADVTSIPVEKVRRPRPKYLGLTGEKPVMGLEHVKDRRAAFIVEGPFDLLAATGWGLPAFAICGTHFPSKRLPALEQALAIYGVFDPDRAGRSAAERFAPLFGSRWRPVRLPNNLDLAELAAFGDAGREVFDILVGRARAAAWQRAQAL